VAVDARSRRAARQAREAAARAGTCWFDVNELKCSLRASALAYGDQYNMEGSLLYPGVDAGVQGFITSIRLKQIREGLEDYEYLTILAQRRSRAVAEHVVKKIARNWHDWDSDARQLLLARAEIARLILAK
jgi:hypothetical protein